MKGQWVEDLWADGKLDHNTYQTLSLRVRKGHAARKRDLQAVMEDEASARVDAMIQAVGKDLEAIQAPFREFKEVENWEDSFLHLQHRWKILVLNADTASGKSTYGEQLFENPFCITVEDAQHLDLKGFDRDTNDGIVLDNVNTWKQLLSWRAVLQARNAKSKGGQSATNIYAYSAFRIEANTMPHRGKVFQSIVRVAWNFDLKHVSWCFKHGDVLKRRSFDNFEYVASSLVF